MVRAFRASLLKLSQLPVHPFVGWTRMRRTARRYACSMRWAHSRTPHIRRSFALWAALCQRTPDRLRQPCTGEATPTSRACFEERKYGAPTLRAALVSEVVQGAQCHPCTRIWHFHWLLLPLLSQEERGSCSRCCAQPNLEDVRWI